VDAIDHNSAIPQQKSNANSVALALLRIAVGFFFVVFGPYKVFGSGFVHSAFANISVDSSRWSVPFHDSSSPVDFGPRSYLSMAFAVGYGEFLIGISLVIGLFSRVASLFGCALMPAMWLLGGYPGPRAALWMY
jgi:uncharacterized membrane protein YphA (DoxX/SURF4 family)